MKKSSNFFDLITFTKKLLKYILNTYFKKSKKNNYNFEYIWKTKSSIDILEGYWNKKNYDVYLSPLIEIINKNNIKNILEIGCGTGGILKVISLNCKTVKNIYGTDFNQSFINFGQDSCKNEKINNIILFNVDIDSEKIFELIKEKKIDLIITVYTMCQLKTAETKIDQIFKLINNINPKFLYFAEIFDFNNKIKIFRSIQKNAYPNRIILNYDLFKKNLINYEFKLLKENYNNCAVKFSQIGCKKFD